MDDLASLPFARPLKRSDFLVSDFSPTDYLATLRNRHQTLEDLRAELRVRSSDLSKELFTLVNENYQDFLSLGHSLNGEDEKIEGIKFGLLGFRREIQSLIVMLDGQEMEIEALIHERQKSRAKITFGRGLLELARRIEELEEILSPRQISVAAERDHSDRNDASGAHTGHESASESESTEEEEGVIGQENVIRTTVPVQRLMERVRQLRIIEDLAKRLGLKHPFVINCDERRMRLRRILLLDLNSALKYTIVHGEKDESNRLCIVEAYRLMAESPEYLRTS